MEGDLVVGGEPEVRRGRGARAAVKKDAEVVGDVAPERVFVAPAAASEEAAGEGAPEVRARRHQAALYAVRSSANSVVLEVSSGSEAL